MNETVDINELVPDDQNARTHGDRSVEAIAASLEQFGQVRAIVIDQKNKILAGNGVYLAAQSLGWQRLKVERVEFEGAEATAYAIADNRIAELSAWDSAILTEQLGELPRPSRGRPRGHEGRGIAVVQLPVRLAQLAGLTAQAQGVAGQCEDLFDVLAVLLAEGFAAAQPRSHAGQALETPVLVFGVAGHRLDRGKPHGLLVQHSRVGLVGNGLGRQVGELDGLAGVPDGVQLALKLQPFLAPACPPA